jgi:hypothetical protein
MSGSEIAILITIGLVVAFVWVTLIRASIRGNG